MSPWPRLCCLSVCVLCRVCGVCHQTRHGFAVESCRLVFKINPGTSLDGLVEQTRASLVVAASPLSKALEPYDHRGAGCFKLLACSFVCLLCTDSRCRLLSVHVHLCLPGCCTDQSRRSVPRAAAILL